MPPYPPDIQSLFQAQDIIYGYVDQWQRSLTELACRKGCSICCTDRVTVTQAEAARILMHFPSEERPSAFMETGLPSPCTTNEFALICMLGKEEAPADFPENPGACPYLSEKKECTVYPVRPLMCRLYISRVPCLVKGEATIPDRIFLMQIILQQLMEHLSRGTRWGNLITMLRFCRHVEANALEDLRICKAIPAFPITTEEKGWLAPQLNPLFDSLKRGGWLPETFSLNFGGRGCR